MPPVPIFVLLFSACALKIVFLAVLFLLEPSPRLLFVIVPLMVILVCSIINALMVIAVTIFAITVVLSPTAGEGRRWRRERNGH